MTTSQSSSNSQQINSDFQDKLQNIIETLQLDDAPAGGCVVVYHRGKLIATAQVGQALPDMPWRDDTLALNFSTGKGVLVTLIHVLVSNGLLDYDKAIASYWSAFGTNGKQDISLRDVLTHQSNLYDITAIISDASDMLDWTAMLDNVAKMSATEPANEHAQSAYSALVSGWVLGGLIEKVTNLTLNEALRKYLTEPLGIADKVYFGVPMSKLKQVAQLVKNFDVYQTQTTDNEALEKSNSTKKRSTKPKIKLDSVTTLSSYQELPSYDSWQRLSQQKDAKNNDDSPAQTTLTTATINRLYFDRQRLKFIDYKRALLPTPQAPLDYYHFDSLSAKIPAANCVATASALAKIYAMLANGGTWHTKTFIDNNTFATATHIEVTGYDAVMPASNPNSMLWRLGYHRILSVCHNTSNGFGHMGYNGSFAWCDPSRQLAFSYTHNFDVTMMTDVRQFAITEAVLGWIDDID